mmetsp:Transcript_52997/g.137126  ORF Transcript_52997/g.137126 Transcript_52997/m.137126 type:complete len:224 (-) Transcript_52997:692-1363(-)
MTAAPSIAARCISSAMCKRSARGQITNPLRPNRRQDCRPSRNSTKSVTRPHADPCAPRTALGRSAICGPTETIATPFLRVRWPKAPSSTDGACEPSTSDSSPCAARARPASPRPRTRQPQRLPRRSQSRRTASRRCRRGCGHRRWDQFHLDLGAQDGIRLDRLDEIVDTIHLVGVSQSLGEPPKAPDHAGHEVLALHAETLPVVDHGQRVQQVSDSDLPGGEG